MNQILTDVFWLDLGYVNAYIICDDQGLCLIDTGLPRSAKQILDSVTASGHNPHDITRILLTHADNDHAGGLSACLAASNAAVYASADTAAHVASGRSPHHLPRLLQGLSDRFMGYPTVAEEAFTLIQPGETLPMLGGLEVLATPGHTLDHLSFYSPSTGVLFAGDALSTRGGKLQGSPALITADQDAARHSALRLLGLSPAVFACGHGTPLTDPDSNDAMKLAEDIGQQMGG